MCSSSRVGECLSVLVRLCGTASRQRGPKLPRRLEIARTRPWRPPARLVRVHSERSELRGATPLVRQRAVPLLGSKSFWSTPSSSLSTTASPTRPPCQARAHLVQTSSRSGPRSSYNARWRCVDLGSRGLLWSLARLVGVCRVHNSPANEKREVLTGARRADRKRVLDSIVPGNRL